MSFHGPGLDWPGPDDDDEESRFRSPVRNHNSQDVSPSLVNRLVGSAGRKKKKKVHLYLLLSNDV